MNKSIYEYRTLVFDCDGVILNSNKIKTQAFYEATIKYGHDSAQALVAYHVDNGGISRYKKIKYFIKEILKQELDQDIYQNIISKFSKSLKDCLMHCEVADGLIELRKQTHGSPWLIISGGDQEELREVFVERNLNQYFNGGIFGSPDTKDEIFSREIRNGNINQPCLFIGDSKYDYEASQKAGSDFIFMSDWSEVEDWKLFCGSLGISHKKNIKELLT